MAGNKKDNFHMWVDLYTAAGVFVAAVEVLPYHVAPRILMWGIRYFVCDFDSQKGVHYVEAFMAVSFTHPREAGTKPGGK